MTKLKTVSDSFLIAHSENILDDEELLFLFYVNHSANFDLPYWSYEIFDLDSWSEDECKCELRFLPGDIKNLVNILQLLDVFKYNNGVVVILLKLSTYSLNTLLIHADIKISCTDLLDQYPSYV